MQVAQDERLGRAGGGQAGGKVLHRQAADAHAGAGNGQARAAAGAHQEGGPRTAALQGQRFVDGDVFVVVCRVHVHRAAGGDDLDALLDGGERIEADGMAVDGWSPACP